MTDRGITSANAGEVLRSDGRAECAMNVPWHDRVASLLRLTRPVHGGGGRSEPRKAFPKALKATLVPTWLSAMRNWMPSSNCWARICAPSLERRIRFSLWAAVATVPTPMPDSVGA